MADKPLIGITAVVEDTCLKHGYVEAVSRAGGLPLVVPVEGADFNTYAERLNGLLIPGGRDIDPLFYGETAHYDLPLVPRQRTDFEINLFREIIKKGKPVLGICYGMQLMNIALGGSLFQDIKKEVGHGVNHKEPHSIEIFSGPLRAGGYFVNSSHHQAVKRLGDGLEAIAYSKDGLVEAFFGKEDVFLLGIQWHPERMDSALSDEIFASFMRAAKCR